MTRREDDLAGALSDALMAARFDVIGHEYSLADYRQAFGSSWLFEHPRVVVPQSALSRLDAVLAKEMDAFADDEGRVVTGAVFVTGGGPSPPGINGFSRGLVASAALFGLARTVEAMLGWIDGEPVHFTRMVALSGITVDDPLELYRGVRFMRLPHRSEDLAKYVPGGLVDMINTAPWGVELLNTTVLCYERTVSPVFQGLRDGLDLSPAVSGAAPAETEWPLLRRALSLACDSRVHETYAWTRVEDGCARVILRVGGNGWTKQRDAGHSMGGSPTLTQALLDRARDLVAQLRSRGGVLDLAIDRWMKSKQSQTDEDQFIDLRIALESLYARDGNAEAALRVAIRGAWHLGSNVDERKQYYDLLRKLYARASKVAHAKTLKRGEDNRTLLDEGKAACRVGILKCLDAGEPDWNTLILGARSLRRRTFAARNGSSAHALSSVSGPLRGSAARGGFWMVGEQKAEFGPRGPHGPPETAMRVDFPPWRASSPAFYAAISTCRRLTFNARHTKSHSQRTFASPRRLKRRKPSTCLIQP
jgi:hypothetical protein